MRDALEFIAVCAVVVLLCAAAVLGVFLVVQAAVRYECNYYGRVSGIETEFNWIAGCYVRSGNKMIPYSEYKARAITNEEKQP